jgi:MoxR-like ATPase
MSVTDGFTAPTVPPRPADPALYAVQLGEVLAELRRVVVGQERVLERVMVALLAGGHCLLEGVPGIGKTLTVSTLAKTLGGSFARIQFTPDLLPSDIVGTRVYRPSTESFDVELGPVFANFVLTDEINRAPAKVQSALLEVMAERQVSLGGVTHSLPAPFLVLATQNPIESEGVYPLPEAQRDRFLMRIPVDYPTAAEEHEIVHRTQGELPVPNRVLSTDDVAGLQQAAASVYVDAAVQDYAIRLVLATRHPDEHGVAIDGLLAYGASPRASIGLIHAGRALALLRGRTHLLPQDVYDIAYDVLNHRLVLSFDAVADGVTVDDVLVEVLTSVVAPRRSSGQFAPRVHATRS